MIVISVSLCVCAPFLVLSVVLFLVGIHVQTTAYQLVRMGTWEAGAGKPQMFGLLTNALLFCDS